eukprot:TRINITY_DN16106_c0_g1_i2.p1 TRINITY_DN16106_c0_g1~~TRINITY_DN16106_c0_g1_i2.p1  ORF type:complete len:237 (+),score=32.10 TRINITY_DN16106_c0_g1_i2:1-711(+)
MASVSVSVDPINANPISVDPLPKKKKKDTNKIKTKSAPPTNHARRLRRVLGWKPPFIFGPPIVVFLFLNLLVFVVAFVFWRVFPSLLGANTPVYMWVFLSGVEVAVWWVLAAVISGVLSILERFFFFSLWFYYINTIGPTITFIICDAFLAGTWPYFLGNELDPEYVYWIQRMSTFGLVIGCVNLIKIVVLKYIISHANHLRFWDLVQEALARESFIKKLRGMKINPDELVCVVSK